MTAHESTSDQTCPPASSATMTLWRSVNCLWPLAALRDLEHWMLAEETVAADSGQSEAPVEKRLMGRAAQSAFDLLRQRWPEARRLCVLCGGGNNGGDGYLLARLALLAGFEVRVIALTPEDALTGDAQLAAIAAREAGVETLAWPKADEEAADALLKGWPLLVDALTGIGLRDAPRGSVVEVIERINHAHQQGVHVMALDVPSGLNAATGAVAGVAVEADVTLTFLVDKPGLHTGRAELHAGHVSLARLGAARVLPEVVAQSRTAALLAEDAVQRLTPRWLESELVPRSPLAHKGDTGSVLVFGGGPGLGGSVLLASEAAARAGAGKVALLTAPAHISASLTRCPEVMARGLKSGPEGSSHDGFAVLESQLAQASVTLVGPGMGTESLESMLWGWGGMSRVLAAGQPLVVDADGLSLLAWRASEGEIIRRDDWVLTPHPGEAARLLDCSVADIEHDRIAAARALQQRFGGSVVLKGAGSLVASPAGVLEGPAVALCPYGNPGMASGGMGDVLGGIIAGLAAQALNGGFDARQPRSSQDEAAQARRVTRAIAQAARLGVLVHALAADRAVQERGERGLLAGDLASYMHLLLNPRARDAHTSV